MASTIPLSSKLAATADQGFFLRQNNQPHYRFDWHTHDCAMLLWPQLGALDSCWVAEPGTTPQGQQLVRTTALLLPASAAHSTRSRAHRQRHGELYLRPELLGARPGYGVFTLDAAAVAMLDALVAPALAPAGREPLVQALLAQLAGRRPAQGLHQTGAERAASAPQRMRIIYARALDTDMAVPTVDTVADELGVSVRSLQRACAAEFGTSPIAVRRRMLAAKARQLMADGMSPTLVSHQLGFTHRGHLNRLLRDVGD